MKQQRINGYPDPVSALCLGTSFLGMHGTDAAARAADWPILDRYYEMGGRLFDTANVYGRMGAAQTNASERMLGYWLRERKISDVVVLTKGCHYDLNKPQINRVCRAALIQDLDESRAALGLDQIPMYFLHRDDETQDIRGIVDLCMEQVEAGRVLRFGFSNYAAHRIRAALEYLGPSRSCYLVGVSNEWSLALSGASYVPVLLSAAWLTRHSTPVIPVMGAKSVAHMEEWNRLEEAEQALAMWD